MIKVKKIYASLLALALAASLSLYASEKRDAARVNTYGGGDGNAVLGQAYNAYAASDWQNAAMLFRKALSDPQNESDSTLYMLISAEMKAKSYKAALADSSYFLQNYPDSRYFPLIQYQQGRCLFYLGEFDKAVLTLSDFCHQNPDSEMYASSLFWIAEAFYAGYNFEQARPLYERVADDFPKDSKALEARYRLDAINQRLREEKLLRLLQQTGESYLSSKENYEKALRRYELESAMGITAQESAAEQEAEESEEVAAESSAVKEAEKTAAAEQRRAALPMDERGTSPYNKDETFIDALQRLKKSAAEAQGLLERGGE